MNHSPVSRWALGSLLLMLFLAAIDTTILSTAMPEIIRLLGQPELYHWCFTAFMLTSTLALPFFGRWADQFGIRPCMLAAGALFVLGSLVCLIAESMPILILGRALQGLGASGLQSLPMIAFGVLFSPAERGSKQSLISMVWGFSSLAGPTTGGLLVSHLSWHWIFGLNVALGLVALTMFWVSFPRREMQSTGHALDWISSLLLTMGLGGFLLLAGQQLPALQGVSWLAVLGILGLFVWRQTRYQHPLIPMHPFLNPTYRVACLLGFTTNLVGFGALTYVPLYLQQVLKQTPEASGLVMTPMMLAWPIASSVGGIKLNQLGFRKLMLLGGGLLVISMAAWALLAAGLPVPGIIPWCICLGLGMGAVTPPLLIAVQTVVDRFEIGVASSTLVLLRNIGATLGISLMGTLVIQTQSFMGIQNALALMFVVLTGFALLCWLAGWLMPNCPPAEIQ